MTNKRRTYVFLISVFLAGSAYRSISLFLPDLWPDEATIGLMARDVTSGIFLPVFFYAQAFMGSLEAYLYSGLFRIMGPTTRAMELLPFLIVSLIIIFSAILTHKIYGYTASVLTIALLSFAPAYFARWNFEARPHYSLTVLFGTLGSTRRLSANFTNFSRLLRPKNRYRAEPLNTCRTNPRVAHVGVPIEFNRIVFR